MDKLVAGAMVAIVAVGLVALFGGDAFHWLASKSPEIGWLVDAITLRGL